MDESQNDGIDQANSDKKIRSIEDLLHECRNLKKPCSDDVQLYFRGQRRDSWELRPSVMRRFSFRENESEMLNELMTRQPEAFSGLTSAFSQWVLAQHHGLKTRLLDITLPAIPVYDHDKWKVPGESKEDIMEELRLLNITRESLFPGLDEAATAVTQRYS